MWHVYGVLSDSYMQGRTRVYGPLPCKRWVYEKPWRKPSHGYRIKHRVTDGCFATAEKKSAYNERKAIQYARWLAARDGVELPGGKIKCGWSSVATGKQRNQHFYDGTRTVDAYEKRIKYVEWGREKRVYNTLKDGTRGAYLYTTFVPDLRIEIPHWDFVPRITEETFLVIARNVGAWHD